MSLTCHWRVIGVSLPTTHPLVQQGQPATTSGFPASCAGMARTMAVIAEADEVLQVVGATFMQMLEVVDFNALEALPLAVGALVAVPGQHSPA